MGGWPSEWDMGWDSCSLPVGADKGKRGVEESPDSRRAGHGHKAHSTEGRDSAPLSIMVCLKLGVKYILGICGGAFDGL